MSALLKEYLALPYRKCKFCRRLDPDEKKRYNCFKGNPQCPAREVKFVVGGLAKALAIKAKKAVKDKDFQELSSVFSQVANTSEETQKAFNEYVGWTLNEKATTNNKSR